MSCSSMVVHIALVSEFLYRGMFISYEIVYARELRYTFEIV